MEARKHADILTTQTLQELILQISMSSNEEEKYSKFRRLERKFKLPN